MTTDEPPPNSPRSDGTDDHDWPPSNYPILMAIVFLAGAALALVVSTEAAANRLATYAYYALAVGVVLRLVEHVGGSRLRATYSEAITTVRYHIRSLRERD